MAKTNCPICENGNCDGALEPLVAHYNCPRCGIFDVVGTARGLLPDAFQRKLINRSTLSHLVRLAQSSKNNFKIYEEDFPRYQNARDMSKPREQADNLILWIGANQASPDAFATSQMPLLAATVGTAVSGSGEAALCWLLDYLKEERLIDEHGSPPQGSASLKLQMRGWDRFEELQRSSTSSRLAFMAMKFNDETIERVLQNCFKPAVANAGFELRALNETQPAGLIDNQIRAAIRRARFVVADLSHDNNGAYFEAGFAEGIGVPVIYTCERNKFEAKKTHFDTNHMVTIPWDVQELPEAGRNLTATIRATFPADANRGA
jgi:hypothetical protein